MKRSKQQKSKQKVILNNAYQQITLIDQQLNKLIHSSNGPKQFQGLFSTLSSSQQGVQIQKQPLYFDQVDHNIQQVGIMAVKQVKYLTDEEWEQWIKQKKIPFQFQQFNQNRSYKHQSRHQLATKRPRNQKGQFLSKPKDIQQTTKNDKKRKIKKKRGRKPQQKKQQQLI